MKALAYRPRLVIAEKPLAATVAESERVASAYKDSRHPDHRQLFAPNHAFLAETEGPAGHVCDDPVCERTSPQRHARS